MNFKEYKEQFILKLNNFIRAYEELEEVFENDIDCNNFICENYPFEKSFDEYLTRLYEWQESIMQNLDNYGNILKK